MINGAHAIIHSTNADADRVFLKDILGFPHVDAGDGWLIFALPPAEVAVHPSDRNDRHELYLICDDVSAFVAAMRKGGIACDDVRYMGWGLVTSVTLPSGGRLGVYEPRHARPIPVIARTGQRTRKPAKKAAARKRASSTKRAAARRTATKRKR